MSGKITFSGTGTAIVAALCLLVGIFAGWKLHPSPSFPSALADGRDTIYIHDTIPGDSIPYLVIKYYPRWDTVEVPTAQSLSQRKIDTAAILAEHYASYYYSDTITDDTSFFAIINDEVSQNKIQSREYWHRNLRPIAINTTIVREAREPPLSAGPYIGYGQKFGIGLQGAYHPPDTRRTFTGAIGTDGVRVGIMWQIRGAP